MNNFEGSDCNVSMEYVMIPHSLVTVTAASKALIAAFLFVIHHVSMEHAMKLLLPVTVQTTLKALTAVVSMEYVMLTHLQSPMCQWSMQQKYHIHL
jgi:hypothetical protein